MNTISATEAPQLHQIDLTQLTIPQLTQLKQQLEQELNLFQESLQNLKMAQTKVQNSGESLDKITPNMKDRSIMVPLTESIYVPGTLRDPENVIIEIGTGYYTQKDMVAAKDYFKRKTSFVTEQMEKIQMMGLEKSKIRDAIIDVMEMKMQNQSTPAQS